MVAGDDGDYEFGRSAIRVRGTKFRGLVLLPQMVVQALATPERPWDCPLVLCCPLSERSKAFAGRDPRGAVHLLSAPFGPPSTANTLTHM